MFVLSFVGLDNYEYSTVKQDMAISQRNIIVYSQEYGAYVMASIICFLFMLFTGILLLYHTYLIVTNQTTWEHNRRDAITYMKGYPIGFYPFDKGCLSNLKLTFAPL